MSDDYEVGFRKPPRETQFKPGQSGNAKGRRRGSKNLSTMVKAAIEEPLQVTVAGRRRRVSKLEAALIQQANKAAGGDLKATRMLVDLAARGEALDGGRYARDQDPEERRKQHALAMAALRARFSTAEGGDGL